MAYWRVLKYRLFDTQQAVSDDVCTVEMPGTSKIIHAGMQHGVVTIWALVDAHSHEVKRRFHIAGTGHLLPSFRNYIGTVFDRQFVWHIFEVT